MPKWLVIVITARKIFFCLMNTYKNYNLKVIFAWLKYCRFCGVFFFKSAKFMLFFHIRNHIHAQFLPKSLINVTSFLNRTIDAFPATKMTKKGPQKCSICRPNGSFHAERCKHGHDPFQNLMRIFRVVTIYKKW